MTMRRNFFVKGVGSMLRKLFWKQKEDEAPEKEDEQNDKEDDKDKPKYPEMWFVYDQPGTCLGNIALDATGSYSVQISKDDNNPYFDELFTIARPLGSKGIEWKHSVLIADVDKEELIEAFNNAGFVAIKADDKDHDELIRELDKLQTVKGGESKTYK